MDSARRVLSFRVWFNSGVSSSADPAHPSRFGAQDNQGHRFLCVPTAQATSTGKGHPRRRNGESAEKETPAAQRPNKRLSSGMKEHVLLPKSWQGGHDPNLLLLNPGCNSGES